MTKTISDMLSNLSYDKSLKDACERVYKTLVDSKPQFEAELSRELLSPEVLRGNTILHGSYLKTALDIPVSEGLFKKERAKDSIT